RDHHVRTRGRIQQGAYGVAAAHLLLQVVGARLDGGGIRVGTVGGHECVFAGHHVGFGQGAGDLLATVPLMHHDLHIPVPRTREVGDLLGLILCQQGADQHPSAAGEQCQGHDHHQEGDDVAAPLCAAFGTSTRIVRPAGPRRLRRLGCGLSGFVEEVRHRRSSMFPRSRPEDSRTTSPGAVPLLRSSSSAVCKIITAATWSTTARCLRPARPDACNAWWAETVVSRSSTRRTVTGSIAVLNQPAYSRTPSAAGPSVPFRLRGRPTRTSTGWCSSTSCISSVRPCRCPSRATVRTGVATMPSGSQRATPMRTLPTSTARRTPGRSVSVTHAF